MELRRGESGKVPGAGVTGFMIGVVVGGVTVFMAGATYIVYVFARMNW